VAFGEWRIGGHNRRRDLGDRVRLAGEDRLGHLGIVGGEHPPVGGHPVTRVEQHEIAGDQLYGGNFLHPPVAPHPRQRCQHVLQRGKGGLGPVFLPETE
jgi:hypothetical protein